MKQIITSAKTSKKPMKPMMPKKPKASCGKSRGCWVKYDLPTC